MRNSTFNFSLLWLFVVITSCPIWARANVCDQSAIAAAREFDLPERVLLAITRVETGRKRLGELEPWPWTVNDRGQGHWFQNQNEMKKFISKLRQNDVRSFDVGCFQLNFHWHIAQIGSLDKMMSPKISAQYAAEYLRKLYLETGNWNQAAAFYHSRTPNLAQKYRRKFEKIYSSLTPKYKIDTMQTTFLAENLGSLMPLPNSNRRPLIDGLN